MTPTEAHSENSALAAPAHAGVVWEDGVFACGWLRSGEVSPGLAMTKRYHEGDTECDLKNSHSEHLVADEGCVKHRRCRHQPTHAYCQNDPVAPGAPLAKHPSRTHRAAAAMSIPPVTDRPLSV